MNHLIQEDFLRTGFKSNIPIDPFLKKKIISCSCFLQGVVRISKMMEAEEKKFAAQVPHWHHVDCFVERRTELEAEEFDASEIPGQYS